MLALSTRLWDFARPEPLPDAPRGSLPWPAAPFAKLAADWGVDGIHLDARIPERRFEEVVGAIRDHGLAITSMDGLAPQPIDLARREPVPDLVPLANPDDSERRVAVRLHRATIERAADLAVPIVVLHPGRIELPADLEEPQSDERETRAYLSRRALEAPRFVDALRFALDELIPTAEKHGRVLAVAIDARLAAVPSFQELRAILSDFRGAPLRAWLDAVAIWQLGQRGIRRVESWSELQSQTAAIRIADRKDDTEAVPGEGALDHAGLAKALPVPGAIRLLDLDARHDLGRVRDSLPIVRKAWGA